MAPMRSTVPWPSFFQSRKTRPPNGNSPWQWTLSEGVSVPSCSPAAVSTILKIEPGGYWLWMVRFSSGNSGSFITRSHASRSMVPVKRSISKACVDTMASTSPLRGSITTTAPVLPSISFAATDRGHHLRARMRLGGLHEPHGPAHRVHLDALAAILAAQELVEQPLESGLAHHVAAAVAALLELLVVRLADVAEQVRGEAAVRVHALGLDLHDHAGQLELPLFHLLHVRDG